MNKPAEGFSYKIRLILRKSQRSIILKDTSSKCTLNQTRQSNVKITA